ncbi:TIGR00303 family protein [Oculatella sp. LEGE 06141]|uniref:nicotinate mononucleotide-dependent phosphoribosyltransferase CobT n=1 Tax=Oculatella sp. LEGE 06141 TaxID=1828648 RepID=UPI0018809CD2|nr:TIGR00303 family protein [Oculatella sp. LEGE 06141]
MANIRVYTQQPQGQQWLERFTARSPLFACVLGFTETGLIPGISAAGATPADRQFTAIADAEFLYNGPRSQPHYPLPPLQAGASPVLISRAVVAEQQIPMHLFNAGLRHEPTVPCINLNGKPARCVSSGNALSLDMVEHLFEQGLLWGDRLAAQVPQSYVILGECVVGGTTTALAVLSGLGWDANGKVNSSHPACNHTQKWTIAHQGLQQLFGSNRPTASLQPTPFQVMAAVGDPMQPAIAGMAIAASRRCGVLLAGGTQMLAVYALIQAITQSRSIPWQSTQIVVGTTRWVADDPTGDTVGLAQLLKAPLLATQLCFTEARYAQLRAYEQGYVKEGVGAGGCAIAAQLYQGWNQAKLLQAIETVADDLNSCQQSPLTL